MKTGIVLAAAEIAPATLEFAFDVSTSTSDHLRMSTSILTTFSGEGK